MINISQQKLEANRLRKLGKFEEALPLYRELWAKTGDKFDGAGLLHCLRNMKIFDEAILLADELLGKYFDFDWAHNEIIWTYIQGKLNRLNDDTPIQILIAEADHIMSLKPKDLPLKTIVFKVLQAAKALNNWKIVNEWITKIDLASLSIVPTSLESGKEGWSEQSRWYNYRIQGIIKLSENEQGLGEAFSLSDKAIELFPKQSKFFLRLKAQCYSTSGKFDNAKEIYQNLCSKPKVDWWLLHEYAIVLQKQNQYDDALKFMYQAASSNYKLESMVTLFFDIGQLCNNLGKHKEARAHLLLCKYVREDKGWGISDQMLELIISVSIHLDDIGPTTLKESYAECKIEWNNVLGVQGQTPNASKQREIRRNIFGIVNSIRDDRTFCFINLGSEESLFCTKSDLPANIKNGDKVIIDAIPSFDKKKNKDSWRAINIRIDI